MLLLSLYRGLPGTVEEGDGWRLEKRLNEGGTIPAINRCMYLDFDPEYARRMLEMPGLEAWWKDQARQKLRNRQEHWTSAMRGRGRWGVKPVWDV